MRNVAPETTIREIQLEGILLRIIELQCTQPIYLIELLVSDANTYQILIPRECFKTLKDWIEENKYKAQTLIVKEYTTNNQSRYKLVGTPFRVGTTYTSRVGVK